MVTGRSDRRRWRPTLCPPSARHPPGYRGCLDPLQGRQLVDAAVSAPDRVRHRRSRPL